MLFSPGESPDGPSTQARKRKRQEENWEEEHGPEARKPSKQARKRKRQEKNWEEKHGAEAARKRKTERRRVVLACPAHVYAIDQSVAQHLLMGEGAGHEETTAEASQGQTTRHCGGGVSWHWRVSSGYPASRLDL